MFNVEYIKNNLNELGVREGDSILIHSSYKSIGELEEGAKTVFDALTTAVGETGNIVFPTLSYSPCLKTLLFDVRNTPACVGYLPNAFMQYPDVKRSLHPTHSCTVWGKDKDYLTSNHELDTTPVGPNSPITKLPNLNGKILMLGCRVGSMTSMHGVEELIGDMFIENAPTKFEMIDYDGNSFEMHVRGHNFYEPKYLQTYVRLLDVLPKNSYTTGKVGNAECYLFDAKVLWEVGKNTMLENPYYFVTKQE